LAGVSSAHVIGDYLRTNGHMPTVLTRVTLPHQPDDIDPDRDEFMRADAAAIRSVLALWDNHFGGARSWIIGRARFPTQSTVYSHGS
jgi:hypothetical protein